MLEDAPEEDIVLLATCYKCDKFIQKTDCISLECKCNYASYLHKECAEEINKCPVCDTITTIGTKETTMSKFSYYSIITVTLITIFGTLIGTFVYATVT